MQLEDISCGKEEVRRTRVEGKKAACRCSVKTPHTSAPQGKRVRVVLRDGRVLEGKFVERTGQFVRFGSYRIRGADIKSFTIIRGNHGPESA